jgi:hypothetical protein
LRAFVFDSDLDVFSQSLLQPSIFSASEKLMADFKQEIAILSALHYSRKEFSWLL